MKRLLSILMILVLIMSNMTVAFGEVNDYENSWAKNEINYMKGKEILSGYPDGTFRPSNNMSRAEFYKTINSLMGFTNKRQVKFDDVDPTDWYYADVEKGSAANYILPSKSLKAKEHITREEVAMIIGIVFEIEKDEATANEFNDTLNLSPSIRGIIGGLKKNGFISGYPDGTFRAGSNITRAEVVKILCNVSGEIANKEGKISKDIKSNLVVNTSDVVLKDMTIEGNLYLTEGIGDGDVTLDNVTVKGILNIKGGGANSVTIKDSKINKLSVDRDKGLVSIVFQNTTVEEVKTLNQVKLRLADGTDIKIMELDGKVNLVVEKGSGIVSINSISSEISIESKGAIKSIVSTKGIKANGKILKSNTEYKVEDGNISESKPTPIPTPTPTPTPTPGPIPIPVDPPTPKPPVLDIVDKAGLKSRIITVTEAVYGKSYTQESFGPFEIALNVAIKVRDDDKATNAEVIQALANLNARFEALKLVGEEAGPIDPEDPQLVPQIIGTYHTSFINNFGNVTVQVQNIPNAAKFDVVFHLSDNNDGSKDIMETGIVSLSEKTGLIFYNTSQYSTVTIRIYDVNSALLYTFTNITLIRP